MPTFGLLGKQLGHSFSQRYFQQKWQAENLAHLSYENLEIARIDHLPALLEANPDLKGFNVTVPYKKAILPYLDDLSPDAQSTGAVNTVVRNEKRLVGYNTDVDGFRESIEHLLQVHHQRCLVLGTGGAASAVCHCLSQWGMTYWEVSRQPRERHHINYEDATVLLRDHFVLINATPMGTWPDVDAMPPINLDALGADHLVYDLIYNPPESQLLKLAAQKGAQTSNGLDMLYRQAEKAWKLWKEL